MPRTKRPRKQYRPKPVGYPVLSAQHRELALPAYTALDQLQTSPDREVVDGAFNTLGAYLDYLYAAGQKADFDTGFCQSGMSAMHKMHARFERTGVMRPTGPELQQIRDAVAWCDQLIPMLRTDQVQAAYVAVHEILFGETP